MFVFLRFKNNFHKMKIPLVISLFLITKINAHLMIDLSDSPWILENYNKTITTKGSVPGGVYSDLRENGILNEDIFYRFNDEVYRWVGYDNWTYTTYFTFNQSQQTSSQSIYHLVFEGIDTIAGVYLNKHLIGRTSNMFVKYRIPIDRKILMSDKRNELQIRLESPITWSKKQAKINPHVIPSECWPSSYNGECHINLIRKMQASFAWDWGPAFPSMGIWKRVYLTECWSPVLSNIGVNVNDAGDKFELEVIAWFDHCNGDDTVKGTLRAKLFLPNKTISSCEEGALTTNRLYLQTKTVLHVDKKDVERWWPNGYGEQRLYELQVSFTTNDDVQVKFKNIAFRTVELVQKPLPNNQTQQGLGFYFRINEIDMYAKGSNWIPSDVLPEKSANQSRVRYLLESAAKAHFNMMRVWGGGVYESDFFYEECDRLGIMIWQDLMFACNMYPATQDFLSSVTVEVSQQIRRLQHHPSIVIWAGNNENEAALVQNWYGTEPNFNLFKQEYIDLYVKTIKPIVTSLDTSRSYLESSPSNGLETIKEGYMDTNPQSSLYGDVHYYNYIGDLWDPAVYPKTRFTSEYGVQSLPSMLTLSEVAEQSDLQLNSKWIQKRQHQQNGFLYLAEQIPFNLPEPKDLDQFVYISQINQAMAIQTESETYRRMRSTLFETGEGYNMGALYWQLNDVWQAPSWSSIDYTGRWKMLHYYAAKFFAPIIVTSWVTPYDWVEGRVVSDKLEVIPDAKLTISVMSTQHFVPLKSIIAILDVKPNQAVDILSEDMSVMQSLCTSKAECFVHFSLKNIYGDTIAPDSYLFLEKVKNMNISNANVQVERCHQITNNKIHIELNSDAVAFFVWLEVPTIGHFSDNGFHMITHSIELDFISAAPVESNICQSITIRHLKSVL